MLASLDKQPKNSNSIQNLPTCGFHKLNIKTIKVYFSPFFSSKKKYINCILDVSSLETFRILCYSVILVRENKNSSTPTRLSAGTFRLRVCNYRKRSVILDHAECHATIRQITCASLTMKADESELYRLCPKCNRVSISVRINEKWLGGWKRNEKLPCNIMTSFLRQNVRRTSKCLKK